MVCENLDLSGERGSPIYFWAALTPLENSKGVSS